MSTAEILETLKGMSDDEYQAVIEAADRDRRAARPTPRLADSDDDPILRIAGTLSGDPASSAEIDTVVYGQRSG